MQLHSAATSSSNLTGNADDFPQLPVVQAPGSPGAVTRSARRFAALHRAARETYYLLTYLLPREGPESENGTDGRRVSESVCLRHVPRVRLVHGASMHAA